MAKCEIDARTRKGTHQAYRRRGQPERHPRTGQVQVTWVCQCGDDIRIVGSDANLKNFSSTRT